MGRASKGCSSGGCRSASNPWVPLQSAKATAQAKCRRHTQAVPKRTSDRHQQGSCCCCSSSSRVAAVTHLRPRPCFRSFCQPPW